jgi:hypothetical protein
MEAIEWTNIPQADTAIVQGGNDLVSTISECHAANFAPHNCTINYDSWLLKPTGR